MSSIQHISDKGRTLTRIVSVALSVLYFAALGACIAYLWLFAQDRFVTTATIKVSRQSSVGGDSSLLSMALPGLADSSSGDTMIAVGFVNSADLLLQLEKEFDMVSHYSAPKRDFFYRLDPEAPVEDRLEYYRKRIFAHYDKETGLVLFTVDAYDPDYARRIAASVLQKAEVFVNELNQQVADQQLSFFKKEVDHTTTQVEELNQELIKLQNEHNFINPDEIITANLAAVQQMKLELLRVEAELSSIERDSPGSPRIETLRSRIKSLNELIDVESAKLSGPEQDRLNQILLDYKRLQQKLDFAIQLRNSALTMLEKNRIDAMAQSRFFSVIQNPFTPERVGKPDRKYATITLSVLGLLLFVVLRSLTQSVLDRR